jgi:hypothetical protein
VAVLCPGVSTRLKVMLVAIVEEAVNMPIRVVEIHHHAVRIKGDDADLKANLDFYQGLLACSI